MKASVYYGIEDIRIEDVPTPSPGPGEILLKVDACAICGTDARIFFHGQANVKPPTTTGHEICGIIEAVGEGVTYKPGQKAIVVTGVGCGLCKPCRNGLTNLCTGFTVIGYSLPGAFAEYILLNAHTVRAGNVIIAPDDLPPDEGSIVEPLSCCINGQEFLNVGIGDSVAVLGAGPIGGMHVELARAQGATRVFLIDISESRLEMARKRLSVDVLINSAEEDPAERVLAETSGEGVDVAIVACGAAQAQQQAIAMAAIQGRVSLFAGLPKDRPVVDINCNTIHYRELSVYGAFASNARQYVKALSLVASRTVDARKFITSHVPLDNLADAIRQSKTGEDLKIIVMPWEKA